MTSVCQCASSDTVMPSSRKRRLPLVCEADATGRTLEIYQEIKSALGVPHVNLIFQAYGAHPEFIDLMWKLLRPAVETRDFFVKADRLGAEAYTRMHNYFSIPDLCTHIRQIQFTTGAQHELTGVVDLFHYNNPLLLLIAALQLQAFEDGPSRPWSAETGGDHPVFMEKPIKVTE
jgi:Halocarboxylic acid dehydrogenase DehI